MNEKRTKPSSAPGTRRDFIRKAATGTVAMAAAGPIFSGRTVLAAATGSPQVALVLDSSDALVKKAPVVWASEQLKQSLKLRGLNVIDCPSVEDAPVRSECIVVARSDSPLGRQTLLAAGASLSSGMEALGLMRTKAGKRAVVLTCGSDERGLIYALLELADQVKFSDDALLHLKSFDRTIEKPANQIRSVARSFVSDVEDMAWFRDKSFWDAYLTTLAGDRFNRFSLTFGIGYDFTTGIRDCYFHFAYPFLVPVPGYDVRAISLPQEERDKNLEMLRFIGRETARRGLQFQLGLWTHAYQWTNSPKANYVVEGLKPENHATYCRDALQIILKECPEISGVTFRIHGESGVPEGSYDFWKTIFSGMAKCGRPVEIDMHAKGIDQAMIDLALATSLPVNVSPKFWAEHMGLPYMQGAIRPMEMPPRESKDAGFFAKSSGSRRFLRYGYGDLLAENRRYGVLHRIWPGTQRLLLWGDPGMAAEYGRAASFCGSVGVELCEPLFFKGRKGSGRPGGRTAYADSSLQLARGDFEKFAYTYRVWGRNIYNPDSKPEGWQRFLNGQFGSAAVPLEGALSQASRILPMITTAHCPSAANNNYWPELYTNMPIVDENRPHPYSDTLHPKRFGAVSPLDPEFFSSIDDFVEELLKQQRTGKYSPVWVAEWLSDVVSKAEAALMEARPRVRDPQTPEFRRLAADVSIQIGLGRFFAWKFRAGVLHALYERSSHAVALDEALNAYRQARAAWAQMAGAAKSIYAPDITFGYDKHLRGHWTDRLQAIDDDIADLEKLSKPHNAGGSPSSRIDRTIIEQAIRSVLTEARPGIGPMIAQFHVPPARFEPGKPLVLEATLAHSKLVPKLAAIQLRYRHVNQGETWQVAEMEARVNDYRAAILGLYTESPFPLQYHFEFRPVSGAPWFYPGLNPISLSQPYFVVRSSLSGV